VENNRESSPHLIEGANGCLQVRRFNTKFNELRRRALVNHNIHRRGLRCNVGWAERHFSKKFDMDNYEKLKEQKNAILTKDKGQRALKLLAEIRNAHFEFEGQGGEQLLDGEFWDEVDTLLSEENV